MKLSFVFSFLISISISAVSQITFTDLVSYTEKAVVSITTRDKQGNLLLTGTGFFIDKTGTVLSNLHIFNGANSATITTFNKDKFEIDSIIVSSDEYDIIKFTVKNPEEYKFKYLDIKSINPQKGEDIFTIGNPLGLESTVSKGIISNIITIEKLGNLYQITAPISRGSSGSPVMNMKGEAIGIATFQLTNGQNLNFAIDIDLVNSIKSNDAILSEINIIKALPSEREVAWKIIDSMSMTNEILPYLNEYILKYPSDYRGFLKRAHLFSGPGYGARTLIEDKYRPIIYDHENHTSTINLDEKGRPVTDSLYKIGISKVYQRSIPDYNRALELKSNEPLIYYWRGISKLFYCQTNPNKIPGWTFQSAIDDLLKSNNLTDLELKQNRLYYLGKAYLELHQYNNALSAFNQAINLKDVPIDLTDNPPFMYYEIAKIKCDHLKDTTSAINDLNRAIELSKSISYFKGDENAPSEFLAKRAKIFYAQKKYIEALEDLRKVNKSIHLSDDGRCSYTQYLECILILRLDEDMNEALESINTAIKWDDYVDFFYKTRARVHFRQKEYANALKDLNKALEINPIDFNDWDYSERSRNKGLLNDNIGAIKDIDEAIKRNAKESYYYNLKAMYLGGLGDDIGAERQYDKAIELEPKNADYFISRGWSRYKNKKTDACADWSKAGELGNYEAYDLIQKYCK